MTSGSQERQTRFWMRFGFAVFLAACLALPAPLGAQEGEAAGDEPAGSSSMFGGFGQNSDEPYEILADELEVFDAEKFAVLRGNVNVRQGDSLMKAPYMKVYYADSGEGSSGTQSQGIRRMEARDGVYIESGTQVATGDEADYDAESEIMELRGNVELTDDGNVVKGDMLWVNLRTGESRVTAPESNRIRLILKPNSGNEGQ
ncbi:MAG: LptA/OstA family protein [Pseudomonadota bacterium]